MPLDSIRDGHYLILGGSSGMGYATAAYLLRANAVVTICGRDKAKLASAHDRMLEECGAEPDRLRSIAADATLLVETDLGENVEVPYEECDMFRGGFAATVHKAQGIEVPAAEFDAWFQGDAAP